MGWKCKGVCAGTALPKPWTIAGNLLASWCSCFLLFVGVFCSFRKSNSTNCCWHSQRAGVGQNAMWVARAWIAGCKWWHRGYLTHTVWQLYWWGFKRLNVMRKSSQKFCTTLSWADWACLCFLLKSRCIYSMAEKPMILKLASLEIPWFYGWDGKPSSAIYSYHFR